MRPSSRHRTGNTKGFTVIEAFVGITILLIGLVGPLMLVNTNLQAGRFSRDQITAYYLAQEAVEIIREVRDENFLDTTGAPSEWLDNLPNSCFKSESSNEGCRVDGRNSVSSNQRFKSCNNCDALNSNNNMLEVNPDTGEYGYGNSMDGSRFYRYVQVEKTDAGDTGAIVRVRVGFDTGRYIQEYTTTDYLRDWSPR